MSLINTQVQPFKTEAFVNRNGKGEFITVTEESLKGKWSVLIFMPAAFTFNCPTEIEDAADNYAAFQAAGAEVYIVTTDDNTHSRALDNHFMERLGLSTAFSIRSSHSPFISRPAETAKLLDLCASGTL